MTIRRSSLTVIACVPARPLGPFPFGAWEPLPREATSLEHMVGPTGEETLGDMGL